MGVSVLDGTIEEAVLKRSVRNLRVFHHVRFRLRDGGTKTVAKPIVNAQVAQSLQPGVSGRFYLYASLDQRGIHGVRDAEGRIAFGFPRNNEIAMLVLALINLVWVGGMVATAQGLPVIGTIILLLSAPYYLYLRHLRGEARRRFEADRHFAAAAAPRVEPGTAVGA